MHRFDKRRLAIGGIALVLVALGASTLGVRYFATHGHVDLQPQKVISRSGGSPSEVAIDTETTDYTVAATIPRRINLSSVGTSGFIQQVSIDASTHEMIAPTNIHLAGWYTGSAKPGDTGVSVIDGHVAGRYAAGVFADLGKLKPHSQFSVEYGDGSVRQFEVVKSQSFATADVPAHLFAAEPGISQQLNLITCSGTFNRNAQRYEKRLIIVAMRV